ncbi:MAG: type II toxin-antitoxin system HicA family toxin [Microcystaceae cyanobacterium]
MKVRDVIKKIEQDGWYFIKMKGSHRQYKHRQKSGKVTVPGKPSDELPPGTLNSILKQAQIKGEN